MGNILHTLRDYRKNSRRYFAGRRDDIARENLQMLGRLSVCALVLTAGYFLFCFLFLRQNLLLLLYVLLMVLHVFFLAFSRRGRRHPPDYRTVQVVCTLFIVVVMGFITAVSVFPFPDRPAIFFPIFYLVMTVLFVFPYRWLNGLLTLFEAVFLVLCAVFKAGSFGYDSFSSVTAWILGLVISYLMLDLRLRENLAHEALKAAGAMDATTGLHNRRAFDDYMEKTYADCEKQGAPIAVLLMDIDDFKKYNDAYGHVAGDECLARLGGALRDYAGENGLFIARYGGEEIIAVAVGESAESSLACARGLLRCTDACAIPTAHSVADHVTLSLGVAVQNRPAGDYLELVRRADAALYRAKAQGKHCIVADT